MQIFRRYRMYLALCMICLMAVWFPSQAASGNTGTWNLDANGTWTTPVNWSGSIVPNALGDIAIFRNDVTSNRTVTLDAPVTLGGLQLGDALGTSFVTFAGANALTFDNSSGNGFFSKFGSAADVWQAPLVLTDSVDWNIFAGTLQVNGVSNTQVSYTGTGDTIKNGSGTLQLNIDATGGASYTGAWIVNLGTLSIGGPNSSAPVGLGTGLGGIVLNGTGSQSLAVLSLNNNGISSDTALAYSGNNDVILQGGATINVDRNFLNAANDRITHVLDNLTMNGGILRVTSGNGHNLRFDGTTALLGQTSVFEPLANTVATRANLILAGPITDGGANRALIKEGAGRMAITHSANSYSGVTSVKNGVLELGAGAKLGAGATYVNGGVLSVPDTATLNGVSSAGGLNLVGQLGTSRYALPVVAYSGSTAIDNSNPLAVNVPIAGMVLGIDGVSGTTSTNSADIDLSQAGGGSNRVWLGNVTGFDRTYTGNVLPSSDNTIRLTSPANNLIISGSANQLGGASSTANLVFGYDLSNPVNYGAGSTVSQAQGGTVSVRVNNSTTGSVTVNRGVTANINGSITTPFGTGTVVGLGGTINTDSSSTAQFGNTDFRLFGGTTLLLDNSAVTTANTDRRLLNTTNIDLTSSTFRLIGDGGAATASSQTVASIDYRGGSTISVDTDSTTAGRLATLTTGTLNRLGRGTLNLRSISGNATTYGTASGTQKLLVTAAPTVSNGMIGADIALWGGTTANDSSQPLFATYNATHGVEAAGFTLTNTLTGASTGSIVSYSDTAYSGAGASIQALRIRSTASSHTFNASSAMTIGAAAGAGQGAGLFLAHTSNNTITHTSSLNFGSQEGLIYAATTGGTSGIIALSGTLSGSNGVTRFGDGILRLSGTNTFTGPLTLNAGETRLNAIAAGGGSASAANEVNIFGGSLYLEAANSRYYANVNVSDNARLGNVNVAATGFNNLTFQPRSGSTDPVVLYVAANGGSNQTTAYGSLNLAGPGQIHTGHVLSVNGGLTGSASLDKFGNERLIVLGNSTYSGTLTSYTSAIVSNVSTSTAKPFGSTSTLVINPGGGITLAAPTNLNAGQLTLNSDLGGISYLGQLYVSDPTTTLPAFSLNSTAPWKGAFAIGAVSFNVDINQSALFGGNTYLGAALGYSGIYTGNLTPSASGYLLGTSQGTLRIAKPLAGSVNAILGISMTGDSSRADQFVNNSGGYVQYDVPMGYTGNTILNPGTVLRISARNALNGTGDLVLAGGQLRADAASAQNRMIAPISVTNNVTMTADTTIQMENSAYDFRIAGNIRLGPGSTGAVRTLSIGSDQPGGAQNNAGIVYLDGGISDGAGGSVNHFVKGGPGALFFTGPNSYTGTTTVSGGFLGINDDADWGSSTGSILLTGGGVAVWENSFTTSRNYAANGANGWFDVASGLTLTQDSSSTIDGGNYLMKRGLGTMVLNGSNAQTGIYLADGVLQVNSQASLGNPAEAGATAIQFGNDQTLGGATSGTRYTGGTLRLNFTGATNRGVVFNNNGNTNFSGGIDVTSGNTFTVNGIISQGSELDFGFKTGAGTLITTGANTLRGLAITNGVLQFANGTPWANSTTTAGDSTLIEMLGGTIRAANVAANIALTNQASTTTYNYGGGAHLRMASGAGYSVEFAMDNLLRQNQGTLVLDAEGATILGAAGNTNAGRVIAVNTVGLNLARASALTNGIFAPHLLGADPTGAGFFLQDDVTTGFKAYSGAVIATLSGSAPASIGDISVPQTLTGNNSIYAFRTTADVSGGTLTIPSVNMLNMGGVVINGSNTVSTNLVFDPANTTAATNLTGASTTADSNSVTVASTAGLVPGMAVFGTNIRPGSTILSVNSATSLSLSQTATATGSSLTLTAQQGSVAASGEGLVYVKAGENATISGNVTANQITKFGSGALTLSGNNMVAGDVNVQDGTVRLGSSSAFSRLNSELNLNAGATLDLNGKSAAVESIGPNNRQVATASVGGTITNSGPAATLTMAGPVSSTFNGTLSLNLKLEKAGAGVLTINGYSASTPDAGNNTFTGGTDIYGTTAANITGGVTTNGSAAITVATTQGLAPGMILTGSGIPTNSYITSITGPTTFNISQNATASATGLTFTSVGGLTLNNANFGLGGFNGTAPGDANLYSGNFNLFFSNGNTGVNGTQGQQFNNQVVKIGAESSDGLTLNVRGPGTIYVNQGLVSSNSTFGQGNIVQFGALNMTDTTLNLGGGNLYRVRAAGPISILGSQTAFQTTTDGPSGVLELTGVISGSGALTKLGDGTLRGIVISNPANTYSGGTNIVGGDVQVTATSGTPLGTGAVRVFPDGSLRIAGNGSVDGSKLTVLSRVNAMGAVVLDDNFNPTVLNRTNFTSTYNTALQLGQPFFTQALDLASIADGRAFLGGGLNAEIAYTAATLGAGVADSWNPGVGVYRIAPGASSFAFSGVDNVLTGSNFLQVGPQRNNVLSAITNGGNVLVIRNSNDYTQGTQITKGASLYIETGGRASGESPLGSGAVEVYGELRVRGAQGSLWNAKTSAPTNLVNLRPGGVIRLHEAEGTVGINFIGAGDQGRWGDAIGLDLNGGSFIINGPANLQGVETIGDITARKGGQIQLFRNSAASSIQLNVGDISRAERGVLMLQYNSGYLGINTTTPLSYERLTAQTIGGAAITRGGTTTNGSGAINGGMVAPWIIDRTTNSFMGYDPTATAGTGFQPLISSASPGAGQIAYNKIVSGALTGVVTGDIVDVTSTGTLASNPTAHAMRVGAFNISPTATNNTITLSSGGLIMTGGTINPTGAITSGVVSTMTLNFGSGGAGEALIYNSGTAIIQAQINALGLTKFGSGQLQIHSINPGITGDVVLHEGTTYVRVPYSMSGAAIPQVLNSQDILVNGGTLNIQSYNANAAGTASEIASNVASSQALLDSDIFIRGDAALRANGSSQYVRISDLTIANSSGSAAMDGNGFITLNLQSGIWVRGTTTLAQEAVINSTFDGFAQSTLAGQVTGSDFVKYGNGTVTMLNATNNYAGGTVIWGTTNATTASTVASALRGSGTPFGTGDIQIQPGGLLRMADNANIASNAVFLRSDGYGLGGIGLAHNSTLPTFITLGTPSAGQIKVESTGPFDGVLSLDYGYYSQDLNPAAIAGGNWWIGNSQQAEAFYFNDSIGTSGNGKYLLGGGGNQSGVNFGGIYVSAARTPLFENLFTGGTANNVRIEVGAQTGDFAWNAPSFVNGNTGFINLPTRNTDLIGDVRVNTNSVIAIGNNFALGTGRLILNGGTVRYDLGSNSFATTNITLDNNLVLQGDWATSSGNELVLNGNVAMSDVLTAGATRIWNLTGSGQMAVGLTAGSTTNGVISGADGSNLIKRGAQLVSFRGANTYQGFTQIDRGEIVITGNVAPGVPGPLGVSTSPILLGLESTNNAGSLGIGGKFTVSRDILVSLAAGTGLNLIEARTNETSVVSGGISVAGGATLTVGGLSLSNTLGTGGALVLTGPISGAGTVTFGTASAAPNANGPVSLTGTSNGYGINTYSGGTTFNTTRVEIGGDTYSTGPATNPVILSGPFGTGAMTWTSGESGNGATFLAIGGPRTVMNAFNPTSSAANATWKFVGNQALTFTRDWNVNSDNTLRTRTLQVSNPYQPVTFTGNLSASGTAGVSLVKAGSGMLILNGTNTFGTSTTTGVQIDDGILRINSDAALGAAGHIRLNGGSLSASNGFTTSRVFVLQSGNGGIDVASTQTLALSSATTGAFALRKTGPGTLALNNSANTVTALTLGGAQQLNPNVGFYSHTGGTVSTIATSGTPFAATSVTINSGTLSLVGGSTAQSLTIPTINYGPAGAIALNQGTTTSTLSSSAAFARLGTFNSVNYGTLTINPSTLSNLGATEKFKVTTGAPANTSLTGGFILSVPSIFVALSSSSQNANFARYDATNGFMEHNVTTVATLGSTAPNNVGDIASDDIAGAGAIDIGALRVSANISPTDGSTLIRINNGGLILNGAAGPVLSANTLFGTASSLKEAIVYVRNGQTDASKISGSMTALDFTKTGPGTLELSGTGNTLNTNAMRLPVVSVQNGILRFATTGAQFSNANRPSAINAVLGNYVLSVNEEGIFDLNGLDAETAGLTGNGTVTSGVVGNATLTVRNGTGVDTTFSGRISDGSGTLGLTKRSNGVLYLNGYGSYTGGTTIDAGRVINATGSTSVGGGRLEVQTASALGTGPVILAGGDLRFNAATLLDGTQTTSEVTAGIDGFLFGGPNGLDVNVAATATSNGVALPANTTSVIRAATQNALINQLTVDAPMLTSTEGLVLVKGSATFSQANTVLRTAGGRLFLQGQINAGGNTITKTGYGGSSGVGELVVTNTAAGAGQNQVGLWKVYGGILNPRSADGAANPLGASPTVELNGGSTSYGLLLNTDGDGTVAAERVTTYADTTIRFGSALPVSSSGFVSSGASRLATDRVISNNDDKTIVVGNIEARGALGSGFSYFLNSNSTSLWVDGTTSFERDWSLQADGTAITFNGAISGNGTLSRRSNGATVYFNAENTYNGGTFFNGSGRNLLGSYEGNQVTLSNTAKLGYGHVFVGPLATFQINAAGNLRAGQNFYVTSNLSFSSTFSLAADLPLEQVRLRALGLGGIQNGAADYFLSATNPSLAVLGLGTVYTQPLDQRALGDGMWFLGSATNQVGANGSYDAATLRPGLANTYRLGAGGGTLFFGSNGNANILRDFGGVASQLVVGAPMTVQNSGAWSGGTGTVVLLQNQSYTGSTIVNRSSTLDFRGTLATSGMEVLGSVNVAGEAGTFINPITGNNIPVTLRPGGFIRFDNTSAGALPTSATEGRWQDSVGFALADNVIRLQGSPAVEVTETVGAITAGNGGNRIEVVRGVIGRGTELRTPSITRVNNGTLQFVHNSSQLGSDERVIVTGGAPTVTNGMVAPWMVSASDNQFVTYNADTGFTIAGFDRVQGAATLAATVSAPNDRSYFNGDVVLNSGVDFETYALRISSNVSRGSSTDATAQLILGSGGLLVEGARTITPGIVAGSTGSPTELLLYNNSTATIGEYANPNTAGQILAASITKFGGGTLSLLSNSAGFTGDIRLQQGALTFDYRNTADVSTVDLTTTIGGNGGNVIFQGAGTTLNLRAGQDGTGTNFTGTTVSFNKGLVLADYLPTATVYVDRSAGNITGKTAILSGGITFGQNSWDVGQVLRFDIRNSYSLAVHGTTTLNGRSTVNIEDAAYGNTSGTTLFLRGQVTGTGTLIKGPADSKSRVLELDYVNGLNDYTGGNYLHGGTLRSLARATNVGANAATNLVAGGLGNGDITLLQGTLDLRLDDAASGAADADIEFVRYTSGTGAGPNLFMNGSTTINVDRNFYTGTYTRTAGTVVATLPGGHNFTVGQSITVSTATGATTGNFTLTAVTPTSITYTDGTASSSGAFVVNNNSGSNKMVTFNNLTIGSQILTTTGGNGYGLAFEGTTTLLGNTFLNNATELVLGGAAGASGAANSIKTDGGSIILNKVGTGTLWVHSTNNDLKANVYINAGLLAFGNRAVGNATATLGSNDIFVNPGASIQVRGLGNINTASGQQVVLTGTPYSASVFRSVGVFTQAEYQSMIASGASNSNQVAVLALEANNNNALDFGTLGNGRMYLGANGDRTYGAPSIAPGLANLPNSVIGGTSTNPVYRFTHTSGNTLVVNLSSGGIGNLGGTTPTDVQIGNQAILGTSNQGSTGYVSFQDQNTYTGQTVISRFMTLRPYTSMAAGDTAGPLGIGAGGAALVDVYGGLRIETGGSVRNSAGTGQFYTNINFHPLSTLTFQDMTATGAASNRWDDSTGIKLDGSAVTAEATNNANNNSETVGAITFDRGSRINLTSEGTGDSFLTAPSVTRASASTGAGTGRGTLVFNPSNTAVFGAAATDGVAQQQMIFTTAPTASATSGVSGMLPGYYMDGNGHRFVKNGANGITPVADGEMVAFSAGMTAGSAVVNISASGTTTLPDFAPVIYALRGGHSSTTTLNSPTGANNDATITLAGSGSDVGAVASSAPLVINPNLKFGATGTNEALFYTGGTLSVNGFITAGSITKFGTGGTLVIANDQSDAARGTGNGYQGGWVVNEGNLQLGQFGSAGNAVSSNTIVLNGGVGGSAQLNLRAQPADTLLNYAYTSGKIYAVDYATIDWDPGADDRVHSIADLEIQQSGGIGNAPTNGTLDAYFRMTTNRNRAILSAGSLTVASNAILNVDASATSATYAAASTSSSYLTNSTSSGLSVASLIGSNRLTKWGDGTLYVRGDSSTTFSGPMVIDEGAVFVTHNGSLGTGNLTINRYGTLEIGVANYQPTNASVTYNEGSIERWSVDAARSGALDLGKATLQVAANQPTTNATVTLNGGGIQAYVNADGHSNAQSSGGVLRILNPNVNFTLAGDSFIGDRNYEGANGLDSGKQTNDNRPAEEYVASGAILEVQGIISGPGGLTKTGYDTVILSGQNNYNGSTTIAGGKLMIGADNALPTTTTLTTTANGVLDLNGQNQTVGKLNNINTPPTGPNFTSGFVTNSGTAVKTLTVGNGATGDFTYGGVIQHNVALTKAGTATMTLTNNNTYTGETTVDNGVLLVNGDDTAAMGKATINSGGTLGGTGTLGGDVVGAGGTLTAGTRDTATAADIGKLTVKGAISASAPSTWLVNLTHFATGDDTGGTNVDLVSGTTINPAGFELLIIENETYQRGQVYTFATYTPGTWSNQLFSWGGNPISDGGFLYGSAGGQFQIDYNDLNSRYTLTAIPEPESWLAACAIVSFGILLRLRRRRSR